MFRKRPRLHFETSYLKNSKFSIFWSLIPYIYNLNSHLKIVDHHYYTTNFNIFSRKESSHIKKKKLRVLRK